MEHATEPNFIGTLGLNWKLFLAQLVNFGIVILILWKWVFKPVVAAMEKRRQKIEDSVQKAEDIELKLKEFEASRDQELRKVRAETEEIMKKAMATAEVSKTEILQNAKFAAEKVLSEGKASIQTEKEKMFGEIREEVANLTIMATEKILREKMDENKDKKMVEEVLSQIHK